jgi:hypothetical protein
MTTLNANGRVRKSLAEQIDRLDGTLDGLADALNESVATAVKEAVGIAVKEAVHGVLKELLTNPAMVQLLRVNLSQETQASNSPSGIAQPWRLVQYLRTSLRRCRDWAATGMLGLHRLGHALVTRAARALTTVWACLRLLGSFKRPLLIALAVGAGTGVAVYCAGPWLCTAAGSIAGFTSSLAVQARLAMRRWPVTVLEPGTR